MILRFLYVHPPQMPLQLLSINFRAAKKVFFQNMFNNMPYY